MIFNFKSKDTIYKITTESDDLIVPQAIDYSGVSIEDFSLVLKNRYGRDGHIFNPQKDSNLNIYSVLSEIFLEVETIPPVGSTEVDYIT